MKAVIRKSLLAIVVEMSVFVLAGFMPTPAIGQHVEVILDGTQQVPPVVTDASGGAIIDVSSDKEVTGEIETSGIEGTAAHIHIGAPGDNGPIIIPFIRTSENTWEVVEDAILTDEQLESFKAGNLYINVRSDAYPIGEIRGQIRP